MGRFFRRRFRFLLFPSFPFCFYGCVCDYLCVSFFGWEGGELTPTPKRKARGKKGLDETSLPSDSIFGMEGKKEGRKKEGEL